MGRTLSQSGTLIGEDSVICCPRSGLAQAWQQDNAQGRRSGAEDSFALMLPAGVSPRGLKTPQYLAVPCAFMASSAHGFCWQKVSTMGEPSAGILIPKGCQLFYWQPQHHRCARFAVTRPQAAFPRQEPPWHRFQRHHAKNPLRRSPEASRPPQSVPLSAQQYGRRSPPHS